MRYQACRRSAILGLVLILGTALAGVMAQEATTTAPAEPPQLAVKDWYFLKDGKPIYLAGFSYSAAIDHGFTRLEEVTGKANYIRTWLALWKEEGFTPPFRTGNGKADLSQYNPVFFQHLRRLLDESAREGVVQELTLFNPWGARVHWENHWWNPANNLQGYPVDEHTLYTLGNPYQSLQERWVDKVLETVDSSLARDFVIIEIDNELFTGGGTWRKHFLNYVRSRGDYIVSTIADYCGDYDAVQEDNDVICLHGGGAGDPERFYRRITGYNRAKPVIFNELYVWWHNPREVQRQVLWSIFMAQGMFCVDYWDDERPTTSLSDALQDVSVLVHFANSMPFHLFTIDDSWLTRSPGKSRCLRGPEHMGVYLAYIYGRETADLELNLPRGMYTLQWMDPATGKYVRSDKHVRIEGQTAIAVPEYRHDLVLRLNREQ